MSIHWRPCERSRRGRPQEAKEPRPVREYTGSAVLLVTCQPDEALRGDRDSRGFSVARSLSEDQPGPSRFSTCSAPISANSRAKPCN